MEILLENLERFDFALSVLTRDDLIVSRDARVFSPRDNALFEIGLFMARLGRSRTLIIQPSGDDLKLPSDLGGLITGIYDWPRTDGDHQAAVGAACDSIRKVIHRLKCIERQDTHETHAGPRQEQLATVEGILDTPAILKRALPEPTRDQVSKRARELWVIRGCPDGRDKENWLDAERELRTGIRLRHCMQQKSPEEMDEKGLSLATD